MPFPLPNVTEEAPGMMAEMLDLLVAERQTACVKEEDTQFDERHKQQHVQRRNHMHPNLRCDLVESEGPCEQRHGHGGESYRGIDANDHAQCQAPCQTARSYAPAQLTE